MLDTERYWQEEWAARVLRWARGKTRTAQEAEDLAQTVLLEWLRAVRAQEERGVCVAEPEHLLWRIARFVWCKSHQTHIIRTRFSKLEMGSDFLLTSDIISF